MLKNIPKDKVLEVVKQGPTFPAKVAKQLVVGGDTVLIGAILSTLVSTGEVRVSHLKIGGSPLYYIPDQESKLEDYIDHLADKDRKTFKLLKDSKVLQDTEQDPLTRVSLRTIKDFAKPFEISYQGQKVLFWRFYAIALEDAESLAKGVVKKVPAAEPVPEQQRVETRPELRPEPRSEPKPFVETQKEVQAVLEERRDGHKEEHREEHKDIHREEHLEVHREVHKEVHKDEHKPVVHEHHEVHHEEHHDKSKSRVHQSKTPKAPKTPKEPKQKIPKIEYDFFGLILEHAAAMGLDIISKEKIKKSEYDMILKNHNTNEYIYCKAKDKPIVNEGDLAPAMIFAQSKKMPCLFMTTGELTQKAEMMLGKELSGMRFERIKISGNAAKGGEQ